MIEGNKHVILSTRKRGCGEDGFHVTCGDVLPDIASGYGGAGCEGMSMLLHVVSVGGDIDFMQNDSMAYMIALSADKPDTVDKGLGAKSKGI